LHYDVIMFDAIGVFIVWILIVNILRCILERIENNPNTEKQFMIVKIEGYLKDTHPPTLIVESKQRTTLYLNDYNRAFEFASQVYYNKWVRVEIVNHYTGILLIHITKTVYSLSPVYE
jgi:hypothetical protein